MLTNAFCLSAAGSLGSHRIAVSPQGALVPRVLQKGRHRRILAVEVHRVKQQQPPSPQHGRKKKEADASYEECSVRVLIPTSTEEKRAAKKRAKLARRLAHEGGDTSEAEGVEVSLLEDSDDDSTVGVSPEFMDTGSTLRLPDADGGTKGWKAKYRFPMKAITVKSTRKNSVTVEVKLGLKRQVREILFDTRETAEKFQALVERQGKLETERAEQKMKVAMGGEKSIRMDENLTFLVEIVSGWDLPAGDFTSSDPFVSCLIDGVQVHRTDFIPKTLDPIWTIKTNSLFLLKIDVKQLFRGEGLLCIVYDYDKLGGNERLGAVTIPPKTIYDAKGERMEFKLGPPPGKTDDVPGYLAVRVRRATKNDLDFMQKLEESGKKFRLPAKKQVEETDSKGGSGNIRSMLSRRSRIAKTGPNAGKREVRTVPKTSFVRFGITAELLTLSLSMLLPLTVVSYPSRPRSRPRRRNVVSDGRTD